MKANRWTILVFACIVCSSVGVGQAVPDEAKRHFDRGMAAVEDAKAPSDYESAIGEFNQAAQLAPDWPDVYYNLGMVQEKAGKVAEAIASLKHYLSLSPDASDADAVRSQINKLEYKQDKAEGLKKVFDILMLPGYRVDWVLVSRDGDTDPDWEVEHRKDVLSPSDQYPFFIMKDGVLCKHEIFVPPVASRIVMTKVWEPRVNVNGNLFEYKYPIEIDLAIDRNSSGSPVFNRVDDAAELSIKGEIVSINPVRIRREQRITRSNGKASVSEFVYELHVN